MNGTWRAAAWGVRGSYPTPEAGFLTYGGHTSCFSVNCGGTLVIFDAGGGLAPLGRDLARRGGPKEAHLLLGHFHLDHLLGLPAFAPLQDPAFTLHIYGEAPLKARLEGLMGPPYWPVPLGGCPARVLFHEAGPEKPFSPAAGLTARTLRGNHPGGSLLYRLEGDGRSVVYALDCEADGETVKRLEKFAKDADLLIWDASFAPGDLRPDWGHSTWEQGLALAGAAGVKRVWMAHFSPDYDDGFLREQEGLARAVCPACAFAREGMVTEL